MNKSQTQFLELLRAGLWGIAPDLDDFRSENTDWRAVLRIASEQTMVVVVADGIEMLPEELWPSKEAILKLAVMRLRTESAHRLLNSTIAQIVTALDAAGVQSVLLKGQGLARNYPVPELRQCGDIDLYVGEENYARVHELLVPVATEIDDVSCLSVGKHFHVSMGKVLIEVHRFADVHSSPTFNKVYQEYASAGLSDDLVALDFGGVKVNTPADNFNAFYVFNHMWHHFMNEGVGLRQVCDWMLFLHSRHGKLELGYLEEILRKMDLLDSWKSFGCMLVDYLGMPAEEFPFYDATYLAKGRKVLQRILAEGNFGQETAYVRKRKGGYWYEKWFSFKCRVSRSFGVFRIFPRHAMYQFGYMLSVGLKAVWKDKVK